MNELASLFSLSFLSSTLLPGGSEAYLSLLALNTQIPWFTLLLIATMGNTFGGFTNWLLGFYINSLANTRFSFRHKNNKNVKIAKRWINKWGHVCLLLSWLPIIGDLLCLVAGIYRLNAYLCILYIFTGKFIRYTILLYFIKTVVV